ncbi:MAG: glycosyltransferase family 2 protein [Xanthomonadaceae bacterium]|nr:glycosyltransferase family 2 protein [Xanthomonadaceae bacterium]
MRDATAESTPVDVVIPVYGEGPQLARVVAALQRQVPPVGRIIISHSSDGGASAWNPDLPGVTVVDSPVRLYAGAARNRGAEHSDAEWVAFVDEDVIVDDGWHAAVQRALSESDAACVLGSIGHAEGGGYWGMSLWFIEFSSVHPYMPGRPIAGGGSGNMVVRAHAMRAIGGFPEAWRRAQDTVVHAQLRAAGYAVVFDPRPVGRHVNLPGFRRMLRHLYDTGVHSGRLRRENPEARGAVAARVPVLSVGLWLARLVQIHARVLGAANGPVWVLLVHTPGILLGLLAWNAGFTREVLRLRGR